MPMLDKFEWPNPEHEADDRIIRNVRTHGCHIAGIIGDEKGPPRSACFSTMVTLKS
jgi:hypothetical protein